MTNAEKYLKDGVDEVAFAGELADLFLSKMGEKYLYAVDTFIDYFHDLAEPQLTEDERVILRNINKNFTHIYRLNNRLQVANGEENCNNTILDITAFGHLFKFIKERRRI